ncbi:biotin carboxyl carrier protein [Halanaerobium saccharolyticum]|uniref:Biotin carboxyl carrier protein n=1 Tax=Halanaerobium saccharolyticum TaxID=43595 RepID=A0A4R6L8M0_9FIRM|nr:biotin/lipoyl-containing protein [Halanaerobium saccharolyticum]TDO71138.1 biotin carboxyl carrier protein [Halanaerobium saccharolyticum]
MKKFRVEVDGEEFIVRIEEIGNIESSEAVSKSRESAGIISEVASKSKPKKADSESKKQPQKEMAVPSDIGEGDVVAPMPGSILEINFKKGDRVSKGDVLIILEAMKMENKITAAQSGTVKEIKVRVGDSVDAEDVMLVIE